MFVRNNPDIDYDALETDIQERIAILDKRASDTAHAVDAQSPMMEIASLAELYALDDENFIQAAYHTFLGRDADPAGFQHHLSLLRQGVSRSAIAAGLRYSKTARTRPQRFNLRSAWPGWLAVRTPLVGRILESLLALLGIANLKRAVLILQRQQQETQRLKRALMLAEHEQNRLRRDAIASVDKELATLRQRWQQDMAALRDENRQLRSQLARLQTTDNAATVATDTIDEGFYLAFEAHFRGPDPLIRERLAFYLPVINERLPQDLEQYPAIDIGCGRGEWLAMLHEAGYKTQGIDLNRRNVETCTARNLEAHQADGIDWLRNQHSESAALISAFHVIEHLSLQQLNSLLTEALRVLRPGGLLILETPNPENLVTAAHLFYTDPTHQHPIPPSLCEFILDYKGFGDIRTHRLHPMPASARLPEDNEQAARWNQLMYGPQDYAVIAAKPRF